MSNETRTKHPSFGTIRLSHVSGWGRSLFGSQLAHHDEGRGAPDDECMDRFLGEAEAIGEETVRALERARNQ